MCECVCFCGRVFVGVCACLLVLSASDFVVFSVMRLQACACAFMSAHLRARMCAPVSLCVRMCRNALM